MIPKDVSPDPGVSASPRPSGDLDSLTLRPITVAATLYRVMAATRLMLVENWAENLLGDDQFAFRRGRSTLDALATLRWLEFDAKRRGLPLYVVSLDQFKCYDQIPWPILFETIERVGFPSDSTVFRREFLYSVNFS